MIVAIGVFLFLLSSGCTHSRENLKELDVREEAGTQQTNQSLPFTRAGAMNKQKIVALPVYVSEPDATTKVVVVTFEVLAGAYYVDPGNPGAAKIIELLKAKLQEKESVEFVYDPIGNKIIDITTSR